MNVLYEAWIDSRESTQIPRSRQDQDNKYEYTDIQGLIKIEQYANN